MCAHEDIVYNNRTQKIIEDTIYHRKLAIPMMDNEYIYGKNDLFALVIILKSLLKEDEVNLFIKEVENAIIELESNLKSIPIAKVLDKMGFPENYKEITKITKKELF